MGDNVGGATGVLWNKGLHQQENAFALQSGEIRWRHEIRQTQLSWVDSATEVSDLQQFSNSRTGMSIDDEPRQAVWTLDFKGKLYLQPGHINMSTIVVQQYCFSLSIM